MASRRAILAGALAVAATILVAVSGAARAAEKEDKWRPMWLVLHKPFHIEIEEISESVRKMGFKPKALQDAIELGLQRNNIPVKLGEFVLWQPTFFVRVLGGPTKGGSGTAAVFVQLVFPTNVVTLPAPSPARVDIWAWWNLGSGPLDVLLREIPRSIASAMDEFSLDYYRAKADYEASFER